MHMSASLNIEPFCDYEKVKIIGLMIFTIMFPARGWFMEKSLGLSSTPLKSKLSTSLNFRINYTQNFFNFSQIFSKKWICGTRKVLIMDSIIIIIIDLFNKLHKVSPGTAAIGVDIQIIIMFRAQDKEHDVARMGFAYKNKICR